MTGDERLKALCDRLGFNVIEWFDVDKGLRSVVQVTMDRFRVDRSSAQIMIRAQLDLMGPDDGKPAATAEPVVDPPGTSRLVMPSFPMSMEQFRQLFGVDPMSTAQFDPDVWKTHLESMLCKAMQGRYESALLYLRPVRERSDARGFVSAFSCPNPTLCQGNANDLTAIMARTVVAMAETISNLIDREPITVEIHSLRFRPSSDAIEFRWHWENCLPAAPEATAATWRDLPPML